MMKNRGAWKAWAFAAALAAGVIAPAAGAEPFRVCADPDNLPFSKAEGSERGLYVDLAEAVAAKLDAPVQYTWYYTQMQRRAIRNTIQKGECDAMFALPASEDYRARGLVKSKPFLDVGYAVVAAPAFRFASLDELKRVKLGVLFSSTPHVVLSTLNGFDMTTFRSTEEVFAALDRGEVQAAFVWGPSAGYENKKRWSNRWAVTPVSGHDFDGSVVVAVRREAQGLVGRVDAALADLRPRIAELAAQYGFPTAKPVPLGPPVAASAPRSEAVPVPATWVAQVADAAPKADAKKPAPKKPPAKAAAAVAAPAAITAVAATPKLSEAATAGRVRFNDQCSHCHGSDGYSPVRERDVRYLKARYGDKWMETATTTIKNGRVDAGMPKWGEILKDGDIAQVIEFLATMQK